MEKEEIERLHGMLIEEKQRLTFMEAGIENQKILIYALESAYDEVKPKDEPSED